MRYTSQQLENEAKKLVAHSEFPTNEFIGWGIDVVENRTFLDVYFVNTETGIIDEISSELKSPL